MDFASGLANLEQAAANSQNNKRRPPGDDRRYQPRPRHHYDNTNRWDNNNNSNYRGTNPNRPQQDWDLDELKRYGYHFPRGPHYHRPPPVAATAATDRVFHIGLLAITIEDMPYEQIWKAWAASGEDRVKVSLLCHAKFPDQVQSEWLKRRMLLHPRRIVRGNSQSEPEYLSYKPAWGSVEITRGMIELLVHGMEIGRNNYLSDHNISKDGNYKDKDDDPRFSYNRFLIADTMPEEVPPVDKFIFISETCVPVTTLEECVQALFAPTKREHIDPTKPRWEPPPAKETLAVKGEEKEDDKDNAVGDKPAIMEDGQKAPAVDNPINRTAVPDETVLYLDTSWVNARNLNSPNTPQNKYERDQFTNIHRDVPNRYRWKADQWMVLSRTHAASILDIDHSSKIPSKDQLWNSFNRINASDEMYFPTSLSLVGILVDPTTNTNPRNNNKDPSPWLERRPVTYTDWSVGMRNPASFTRGIKDFATVARLARKQKTLFARKFCPFLEIPGKDAALIERTGDISGEEWKKEIEIIIEEESKLEADGKKEAAAKKTDSKEEEDLNQKNQEEITGDSEAAS